MEDKLLFFGTIEARRYIRSHFTCVYNKRNNINGEEPCGLAIELDYKTLIPIDIQVADLMTCPNDSLTNYDEFIYLIKSKTMPSSIPVMVKHGPIRVCFLMEMPKKEYSGR